MKEDHTVFEVARIIEKFNCSRSTAYEILRKPGDPLIIQKIYRDIFNRLSESADVIHIEEREIDTICNFYELNNDSVNVYEQKDFPFNKGCLEFMSPNGVKHHIFFEKMDEMKKTKYRSILGNNIKNGMTHYEAIYFLLNTKGNNYLLNPFTYVVFNNSVIPIPDEESDHTVEIFNRTGSPGLQDDITKKIKRFVMVMRYISDLNPEKVVVETKRSISPRKSTKHKKKIVTRKVVTLKPVVNVYLKNEGEKQVREFTAESWTVRGHYRTLKNGKRSWIPPYTKGKGRVEPKTYRVHTDMPDERGDVNK